MLPDLGVEYKTNTTVTKADVASKTLTCDSGETIAYDKLLVATGARVSFLPVL